MPMPPWGQALHRGQIRLALQQKSLKQNVQELGLQQRRVLEKLSGLEMSQAFLVEQMRGYRADHNKQLRAKGIALEMAKAIPLVLGVLSILFPHLKPVFEAILKGLGAP